MKIYIFPDSSWYYEAEFKLLNHYFTREGWEPHIVPDDSDEGWIDKYARHVTRTEAGIFFPGDGVPCEVSYTPQLGRWWPDAEVIAEDGDFIIFKRKGKNKPLIRYRKDVQFRLPQEESDDCLDYVDQEDVLFSLQKLREKSKQLTEAANYLESLITKQSK